MTNNPLVERLEAWSRYLEDAGPDPSLVNPEGLDVAQCLLEASQALRDAEAEVGRLRAQLGGLIPTGNAKADKAWDAGYEQGCLDTLDRNENNANWMVRCLAAEAEVTRLTLERDEARGALEKIAADRSREREAPTLPRTDWGHGYDAACIHHERIVRQVLAGGKEGMGAALVSTDISAPSAPSAGSEGL